MSFKDYVENKQIEKKLFVTTSAFKYKIRRSIAAFANSNGGNILLGASDAKHDSSEFVPQEGIPADIEIGTWLDSVLSSAQLIVPAPKVDIIPVFHDGRSYALLEIKKSPLPIGVRKEVDVPLEYNKRGNQSIVPFSFEDFVDGFDTQKAREARMAYAALWMVMTSIQGLPDITKNMRQNKASINLYTKSHDVLFNNYGSLLSFAKTQHELNDINRLVSVVGTIEECLNLHNERAAQNVTLNNYTESIDQIDTMIEEVRKLAAKISKLVLQESDDVRKMLTVWLREDPVVEKKMEADKKEWLESNKQAD